MLMKKTNKKKKKEKATHNHLTSVLISFLLGIPQKKKKSFLGKFWIEIDTQNGLVCSFGIILG